MAARDNYVDFELGRNLAGPSDSYEKLNFHDMCHFNVTLDERRNLKRKTKMELLSKMMARLNAGGVRKIVKREGARV